MIFRFHRVLLPDQIRFQTSCCQGVRSLLGECVANLLLFLFQTPLVAPDGSLFDSLPALGRIFTCCCRACVSVYTARMRLLCPDLPGAMTSSVLRSIYLGMDVVVRRETQMALLVHCCSRCAGVGLLSFMLMSSHRAMIQIDLLKQLTTSCVCVYIYPKPNH